MIRTLENVDASIDYLRSEIMALLTARVLFPNSPKSWWQRYDLTKNDQRNYVRIS
jgi:hypothetical protein